MKKLILFITMVLIGMHTLHAQENREARRAKFKMKVYEQKVAFIKEKVAFSAEEYKAFITVYDEFCTKKDGIRQKMRDAKRQMKHSGNMDYELMNELTVQVEQEEANLQAVYYQKFKKILPAKKIYELNQAERDFKKQLLDKVAESR